MNILTHGHKYELANFEDVGPDASVQTLQFIEKVPVADGAPGELATLHDGTTNEEVLRVLIDRMNYLNAKFPCRENAIVTTHLDTALLWMEKRTADRKARAVEGKALS